MEQIHEDPCQSKQLLSVEHVRSKEKTGVFVGASFDLEHSCISSGCADTGTIVLESESPVWSSDEVPESQHSNQLYSTVYLSDSSAKSSSSIEENNEPEYETLSSNDSVENTMKCRTSSQCKGKMETNSLQEINEYADKPGSHLHKRLRNSSMKFSTKNVWLCINCKDNINAKFLYCHQCYQGIKRDLLGRPKYNRKKYTNSSKTASAKLNKVNYSHITSQDSAGFAEDTREKKLTFLPSNCEEIDKCVNLNKNMILEMPINKENFTSGVISIDNSEKDNNPEHSDPHLLENKNQLQVPASKPFNKFLQIVAGNYGVKFCLMCGKKPKNGGFYHKKSIHVMTCYECAHYIWKTFHKCPMCFRKPEKVTKLLFG